jgi:hypothetical protein
VIACLEDAELYDDLADALAASLVVMWLIGKLR